MFRCERYEDTLLFSYWNQTKILKQVGSFSAFLRPHSCENRILHDAKFYFAESLHHESSCSFPNCMIFWQLMNCFLPLYCRKCYKGLAECLYVDTTTCCHYRFPIQIWYFKESFSASISRTQVLWCSIYTSRMPKHFSWDNESPTDVGFPE